MTELLKDLEKIFNDEIAVAKTSGEIYNLTHARLSYSHNIAARLDELGYVKIDAVKEQIVSSFKEWKANYPESVFLPRPVGEHSPTFDGCAGRAMRAMLPAIEKSLLRDIDEWAKETCRSEGERVVAENATGEEVSK